MIPGIDIMHSDISDGNLSYFHGTPEEVKQNRLKFLAKHGLTLDNCVAARVTHSTQIVSVDVKDRGRGMYDFNSGVGGDAMLTKSPDLALFLLTADCIPIVLYDPVKRALALAHLSTNNTSAEFLIKIISAMHTNYQVAPACLRVYIGPCIKQDSYVKPKAKFTPAMLENWLPYSREVGHDQIALDLVGRNLLTLREAGVKKANILVSPEDTFTSKSYFSHLRSITRGLPEGRFATLVKLQT